MNKKLPPISIGIPFYNAERFLMGAIKSVLAQTHQDWELILVDDGSTDSSLEIAHSVVDPRIQVHSDGKNKKLAARLNEIAERASFDYIARMDADDLMATVRIERQLTTLMERREVDLVTTGVCSITDDSLPYGVRQVEPQHRLTPYRVLTGSHGIVHAAIVGRKDWFVRNPYDPSDVRAQDYRLWVRACRRNDLRISFMTEPLYFYREAGGATMGKMLSANRIARRTVLENGLSMVGFPITAFLVGRSLTRLAMLRCVELMGITQHMVRARSPLVDARVLNWVSEEIELIRGAHGLNGVQRDMMSVKQPDAEQTK